MKRMRFLLDSNVFLCAFGAPERLSRAAREILSAKRDSLYLSAVTSWEITIKYSIGRLLMAEPPAQCISQWVHTWGILLLDVSHAHAFGVAALPPLHQDPFDRLLIAQARIEQMTLLTMDRILRDYPVDVILCGA